MWPKRMIRELQTEWSLSPRGRLLCINSLAPKSNYFGILNSLVHNEEGFIDVIVGSESSQDNKSTIRNDVKCGNN